MFGWGKRFALWVTLPEIRLCPSILCTCINKEGTFETGIFFQPALHGREYEPPRLIFGSDESPSLPVPNAGQILLLRVQTPRHLLFAITPAFPLL